MLSTVVRVYLESQSVKRVLFSEFKRNCILSTNIYNRKKTLFQRDVIRKLTVFLLRNPFLLSGFPDDRSRQRRIYFKE